MIEITPQAVTKVKSLLSAENKEGYGLRVAIQGGGCSGFSYGLTFENEQRPTDQVLEVDGLRVFVDALSGMYLKGARIDSLDTLQGSGLNIANPNRSGSCGCGPRCSV